MHDKYKRAVKKVQPDYEYIQHLTASLCHMKAEKDCTRDEAAQGLELVNIELFSPTCDPTSPNAADVLQQLLYQLPHASEPF